MDENLNRKEHLTHVQRKLLKFVGIFYKRRDVIPKECCRYLYYAFVHSNIMYSIEIYCNTRASLLTALEHTVNKLLRILQRKRRREIHVVDLYINYYTLPLLSLFKLRILKFVHMFKFRRDKLPVVFYNYFISNSYVHNHSTRQKDEYHLYKINS